MARSLTLNTTTAGTVTVTGTTVQRTGNGQLTYDGLTNLAINGTAGADTFNVTGTASGTTTTIDGKDAADIYTITHTGLAGALNVTDTGATGIRSTHRQQHRRRPRNHRHQRHPSHPLRRLPGPNLLRPGIAHRQRQHCRQHHQHH